MFGAFGIVSRASGIVLFIKPVAAPLPYIAVHVKEAEFIGLHISYRMRGVFAVAIIPFHAIGLVAAGILISLAFVAAACSIFPFGLGRQSVLFAGEFVEPVDELHRIVPAHIVYRAVWAVLMLTAVVVFAHHSVPLSLGHIIPGYVEAIDHDLVAWFLPACTIFALLRCTAHRESTHLDLHHIVGDRLQH